MSSTVVKFADFPSNTFSQRASMFGVKIIFNTIMMKKSAQAIEVVKMHFIIIFFLPVLLSRHSKFPNITLKVYTEHKFTYRIYKGANLVQRGRLVHYKYICISVLTA